ncbi:MAG: DUF1501 domain-containing protein [Gemmataceae bacterium]
MYSNACLREALLPCPLLCLETVKLMDPLALLTRRRLLELGGGYMGLNLAGLWRAQAGTPSPGASPPPIRACILLFFYGGPSHLDTLDLKPSAPAEVRGEFRPIRTRVPGVQIGEHLPRLARFMHKMAIVRSVTHQARLHDSASIHALTGRPLEGPDRELFVPLPQFYPSYGSAVAHLRHRRLDVPFASLPYAFRNVHEVPCQGGGFLGSSLDPLRIEVSGNAQGYRVGVDEGGEPIARQRRASRRVLASQLDRTGAGPMRNLYEKAYRLLESEAIHRAIDLTREPASVRERYGFDADPVPRPSGGAEMGFARNLRGQNLLLARRLVEAGVPFVNVYDFKQQGQNWDAHARCAEQHRSYLLPPIDRALSALIEDLDVRGLLDSTLVVAMGEFGRTPKINENAGRDHWPDCYSVLLAGGGVRGGAVYGASDRIGAYPALDPVTPGDLAATIYWRFGIDPGTEVVDQTGRLHRLATGDPLRRLF